MRKIYANLLLFLLFLASISKAQNLGFEATASTPPSNWTAVTGTWNTLTTQVRTGNQSMGITDPATTGTTLGTTNPFVTVSGTNNYLITIGWGRSNTASNALFYLGYRSGTANTLNPATTTSGQAANVNNTDWSRVVSVSSSTVAAGSYGVSLRGFRSASTTGTDLYIDDIIMYASPSNVADLAAPNPANNVQIAGSNLTWVNGSDNGSPASGIGGIVILRAPGTITTAPTLNDQAMYATTTGASGTSSFTQNGTTWTVVGNIDNGTRTDFSDPSPGVGTFTYVVFLRDLAYNYSTGTIAAIASACSGSPVAGTSTVSPTGTQCAFVNRTLGLSGAAFATGLTYQWQTATTIGGTYTNISGSQNTMSYVFNPTSNAFYRCKVKCGTDSVYSTPVEVLVNTGIAGNFTIDRNLPSSSTNFISFADAIAALACGVTGPVKFTVAQGSGPYTEQVAIPSINGASSTNKITIKGNNESLTFTPTVATSRHVLWLNGADHFSIDSLNISVGGTVAGWGIVLTNQADSNMISNCTIDVGNASSTSTNFIPIVINGANNTTATSGNNANGNVFEKNTLLNGYYGFYLYGSSTSTTQNTGNVFRSNIVKEFYNYGVLATYASQGTLISKNDFSRPARTNSTTAGGVSISTGCRGVLVEKNKVHNLFDAQLSSTSIAYGVLVTGADAVVGNENKIINNVFYNFNGNGTHYGISNSSSDHMQAYHNTIVMNDAAATGIAYGLHQTTAATGVNFRNNLVYITKGGTAAKRCVYFVTTTSTIVANKNVYYLNASGGTDNHVGQFGTANFTSISNWQTANSNAYDQASLHADPLFVDVSNADFTPSEASINGIGDNVNVTSDILDSTRTTTPDPGAYEFSLAGCSGPAEAGSATASVTNICANTNFTLNLSGNSVGTGTSYQWQSSPNGTTWTDLGTASDVALKTTSQIDTTFYRCIARCTTGPRDTSSVVQVYTAALINGIYTINNTLPTGNANFNSFTDAVNALNCGVSGSVIFNVANTGSSYNERVVINQVPGTSATNTIKFNGNGATISYSATTAANRAIILLNGTDHITLDSFMIDPGTATTNTWGIVLANKADSVTIKNCTINMGNLTATGTTTIIGVVVNGVESTTATSGDNANGLQLLNNTFIGGGYSVYLYGNSASTLQNNNCVIRGNKFLDFYNYGVYAIYMSEGLVISQNEFSRPSRSNSTTAYGVFITTGCINALIERNSFSNFFGGNLTGTSTAYAIYTAADGKTGKQNRIINNIIYNFNGNGIQYGIADIGGDSTQIYHNTIVLDDAATTTGEAYGIYQSTAATGIDVRNNIVSITRGGTGIKRAIHFNTITSTLISNKNVLYINAPAGTNNHLGQFGTTNYTTLANWQTANSNAYDQGSLSTDPSFINASGGDLKPTVGTFANLGDAVGVLRDFNDSLRSATTPDPGAIEFSNLTNGVDVTAETLITPAVSNVGCYTTSETVTVRVRNSGNTDINLATNPITVTTNVSGASTLVLTGTANSGTLKSDSTVNITMTVPLDMSVTGSYSFNASAVVTGDINSSNNAFAIPVSREKVSLSVGTITASPSVFCGNGGTMPTLRTTGQTGVSNIKWQQSTTSNGTFTDIASATTNPYTVTTALTQTMYYRAIAICGTQSNNSIEDTVNFVNPQILTTTPRYTCGTGSVTLSATATPGSTINWYAAASGGTALASGNNFTTPSISTTTTYYATASNGGVSQQTFGPLTLNTANAAVVGTYYVNFTVTSTTVINSVNCYFNAVGSNYVLNIRDSVTQASVFTSSGVTTVSGTSTPQTLVLNATLPPGKYQIGWTTDPGTYRNNTGGAYPYSIPGVISITGNTFNDFNYIYYFFSWVVSSGCESARTAVVATVDNTPGCTPLPVNLLQFSGTKEGAINKLRFTTTNETNNKGFYIERSADGSKFSTIGYVASKALNGNSSSKVDYDFVDEKPFVGNNLYRLKQEDKNGKTTLSNIVAIRGKNVTKLDIEGLYPNPANNQLTIQLNAPNNEKVQLIVTDLQGKVVQSQQVNIATGSNNVNLNISQLSSGNYFVKAVCENGCTTTVHKFVKL